MKDRNTVQVTAMLPKDVKLRFFAELTMHEKTFRSWLEERIVSWLENEEACKPPKNSPKILHRQETP